MNPRLPLLFLVLGVPLAFAAPAPADVPTVPPGFKVELYAREPLVRNPCAMAFDAQGRLFVGQGPQYRNPKPDTPGDTIEILIDSDGDGIADKAKTFAKGLNCVQGLAWHGRDLWVANAPDLTIVRDLDGDDVADEYVRVYTDLGNIEHALHGLNWGPDGKLYMSKGTSKGLTLPGRIAPKPFRDLWGVSAPAGTPDLPEPPRTFKPHEYKSTYQNPADDWGKEGGILRADDMGANLEIVARGMRNPFDAAFDDGFNWMTNDNDQYDGDRIMMLFYGAHFGWSHPWSADWTGAGHLPTVPVSGPVFPGSGTGKVYHDSPSFPAGYRGVWFMNDWLRKTIFVYRPVWDGALVQPKGGKWEEFAVGRAALFQPVEIEIGPDDALYVSGWGTSYGAVFKDGKQINEGRIFRIAPADGARRVADSAKRGRPIANWTVAELVDDLGSRVTAWRTNAQDELVRRGSAVAPELIRRAETGQLAPALETWTLWTLGRMSARDQATSTWLETRAPAISQNARLQSLRIAAFRIRRSGESTPLPSFVEQALTDTEPRVRFEAVQAIWQAKQKKLADKLWALTATETDRITFYSAWQALRTIATTTELKQRLTDRQAGVRRAALLALLESEALEKDEVAKFIADSDAATAGIAALWQAKQSGNPLIVVEPAPRDFAGELKVRFLAGIKPAALRITTDGTEPVAPGVGESGRESVQPIFKQTTTVKAALFVSETTSGGGKRYKKIGGTYTGTWTRTGDAVDAAPVALLAPEKPLTIGDVLPLLQKVNAAAEAAMEGGKFDAASNSQLARGKRLFTAAGCAACHRVGSEGQTFGPDLTAMGDKADARHLLESLIEPNAIIAEGFSLNVVTTRDGKSHAGIFREETNRMLTLVQADGQPVSIEKSTIARRDNLHQSIMPSFAQAMSSQQMAELSAWLLAQRSQALEKTLSADDLKSAAARPAAGSAAVTASLAFELKSDRVTVSAGGRAVADYVFVDPLILRPGWQNVFAPGGARVTRVHPPAAPEAVDHPAMHPGVWFGFGDINGADFWRNKGRIEHERFIEAPRIVDGAIRFRSANRLVAPGGEVLGTLELDQRFAPQAEGYLLTAQAKLSSPTRDLVFGDQEEMGFGVRMTGPLIEKSGGKVALSDGKQGAKPSWGNVADWCVYSGTVDGRSVGAAIFASTSNPRRPWWHTRDYGVMVANSFGKRALGAESDGKLIVKRGEMLTLKHGVLFFNLPGGTMPDLPAAYRAFNAAP
jgi:putative membrane-bound dehydrogenase-like protein